MVFQLEVGDFFETVFLAIILRDYCQNVLPLLSKFEWMNQLFLFHVKSSENLWFYDYIMGKNVNSLKLA